MFTSPAPQIKHAKLISTMVACNLAVDTGVCFGYSAMAIQAILLRDTNSFDRRMSVLLGIDDDELCKRMRAAWKSPNKLHTAAEKMQQQFYHDMEAFLNGVSIYQSLRAYSRLFDVDSSQLNQDFVKASTLVLPDKLITQGGLASSNGFYGVYQLYELAELLRLLFDALRESNINFPVAIQIASPVHALTLGYDPDYSGWLFMEVHEGEAKIVDSNMAASKIKRVLTNNSSIALYADVYTVKDHAQELQQVFQKWRATETFRLCHSLSLQRIKSEDSKHCSLLHLTVINNDVTRLSKLLKSSHVVINQKTGNGLSALHYAALNGHDECLQLMLQYPEVDINIQSTELGDSPLILAIARRQIAAAKVLLQHKDSNVKYARKDGYTAMHVAASQGCAEILEEILKMPDVDVNLLTLTGFTPLHLATQYNRLECVRLLLAHKQINVDAVSKYGVTALMFAAAHDHIDVAKEILLHSPEAVNVTIDGIDAYTVAAVHKNARMMNLLKWFMNSTKPAASSTLKP